MKTYEFGGELFAEDEAMELYRDYARECVHFGDNYADFEDLFKEVSDEN